MGPLVHAAVGQGMDAALYGIVALALIHSRTGRLRRRASPAGVDPCLSSAHWRGEWEQKGPGAPSREQACAPSLRSSCSDVFVRGAVGARRHI